MVVWRAVHNEFDVVDALLIRPAVSARIRVPAYYSDLPASLAEVCAKSTALAHEGDFANLQALVENQGTYSPAVLPRLGRN